MSFNNAKKKYFKLYVKFDEKDLENVLKQIENKKYITAFFNISGKVDGKKFFVVNDIFSSEDDLKEGILTIELLYNYDKLDIKDVYKFIYNENIVLWLEVMGKDYRLLNLKIKEFRGFENVNK